ncbi:hypothetical protein FCM35_KLT08630 [Carex littledalei]|uniref:Uncharacterized protein n=1 Tax=Carex littledalei TaxID=544730 RepID=A0A833QI60_9POAL|nr:hypothetical protein FCM35_KLT08630 [Carex littledalei]
MYYSHLTPEETKKMLCRKLCLWHTPTSAPIFTHNQLEPIMTSIHFSPIIRAPTSTDSLTGTASVQWREYRFIGKHPKKDWNLESKKSSWPRLPYPRVDGLHLTSYLAFLGALECFIDPILVANMFHISPTPIDSRDEIHKTVFREIKNLEFQKFAIGHREELEHMANLVLYFYREDTLDDASEETYCQLKASVGNDISKYVRKDGTRKIEEDEKDDSSDFVCSIDDQKTENLKGENFVKDGAWCPCETEDFEG